MEIIPSAYLKIIDQGVLGVILILAICAVVYLYGVNQKLQESWRAEQAKQLLAMHEMAAAMRDVTKVVDSNTEISRRLLYKFMGEQ